MTNSKLIIVSEDPVLIEKTKNFALGCGIECEIKKPETSRFYKLDSTSDMSPLDQQNMSSDKVNSNNVVFFPSQRGRVSKINDLEAKAIRDAIHAYNGNLTEAARALGIGRATLYRKVKLYNINPASARRRVA